MFGSSNLSGKRDAFESLTKYIANKKFINDFNVLVSQFPNEMAKVEASPKIQYGIYFPISNINELRKAQFIAAIQHFFRCHSPMTLQQNDNYIFISYMIPKNIPQKLFIIKFQNCLSCWQQKKLIKERAFTRGGVTGAFFNEFPNEVSAHIGLFLGRKEGGRLALVSKQANNTAKLEEARVDKVIDDTMPQLKSCVEIEIKKAEDEAKSKLEEFLKPDSSFSLNQLEQYMIKPEAGMSQGDKLRSIVMTHRVPDALSFKK